MNNASKKKLDTIKKRLDGLETYIDGCVRGTISTNTKEEIRDHTHSVIKDIKDHIYDIKQIGQGIVKEHKEEVKTIKLYF